MDSLCKDLYVKCVNFLEIQEFMIMLRISKNSHKNLEHLIPWRKPYIRIDKYCFLTTECNNLINELIKITQNLRILKDLMDQLSMLC